MPKVKQIEGAVFGTGVKAEVHAMALKGLKEDCKVLNTLLADKIWLCGSTLTFADVHMFTSLAPAFQLSLDAGFRKAMPALSEWFDKMASLPVVVGRLGYVKGCSKAL